MISKLLKPGIDLKGAPDNSCVSYTPLYTENFVSFSGTYEQCCVGMVDMADSTKISATLSGNKVCLLYGTFLNTMASIARSFGGYVVKNIGDSILYYFPRSLDSQLSEFRRCLDCSVAMIKMRDGINKKLSEMGLPSLAYRVSADYGTVMIAKSQDSAGTDIFGPPVNMCTKINNVAEKNMIILGGDLYEMVKKLRGYHFKQIRGYSIGFKMEYPTYLLYC